MLNAIEAMRAGRIGYFWPSTDISTSVDDLTQSPGYIRCVDEIGLFEVDTLAVRSKVLVEQIGHQPPARVIRGKTPESGLMLLGVSRQSSSYNTAKHRASSRTYWGTTLISGIDPDRLSTTKLKEMGIFLPGVAQWAGVTSVKEKYSPGTGRRASSYTITATAPDDIVLQLKRGLKLVVSAHWESSGSADHRKIFAPVEVICKATRPRPFNELREILLRIQELVSLAYEGFISAQGGTAEVVADYVPHHRPRLWDTWLMTRGRGAIAPKSMTEIPLFSLGQLGGAAGLRRWVNLCRDYPRAVRPVVDRFRLGDASPPVQLMDVAAGIEYWVSQHRKSAAWARKGRLYPLLLANHVGQTFKEFVGKSETWADRFWDGYLATKHNQTNKKEIDDYEALILAKSGRLLLASALLNRAGGSKLPCKAILHSHRTDGFSRQVRELIGT